MIYLTPSLSMRLRMERVPGCLAGRVRLKLNRSPLPERAMGLLGV